MSQKKNYLEKKLKNILWEYIMCGKKFWFSCGSYLIDGQKYKYDKKMLGKQMLLFELAKKILEY